MASSAPKAEPTGPSRRRRLGPKAGAEPDKRQVRRLGAELAASTALAVLEQEAPVDVADAAALVINRTTAMLGHLGRQVDGLTVGEGEYGDYTRMWWVSMDAQGNRVEMLHPAVKAEADLRAELFGYVAKSQHLGLIDRRVRLAEAQYVLMGRALGQAAEKAGLSDEQKGALASALHESLVELQKNPKSTVQV